MAACSLHFTPVFKKIQEGFLVRTGVLGFVRYASNAKGVAKSNQGQNHHTGFKKEEFNDVKSGNVLYHETKLVYCPGLNVGVGGFNKLYAKVPGKLLISFEKTNFNTDASFIRHSFPHFIPPYKYYLNVLPEPMHQRFKLVEKF